MTQRCAEIVKTTAGIAGVRDQMDDLLVVIVNWNTSDLLRGCLASLAVATEGLRVRTVVVDNASTDGSPEMVETDFPWVELIRNSTNVGYARANNQALRRYPAQAKYSLLLNPDTEVPPGTLQAMAGFMESHPEAGIGGCRVVKPDGRLDWACKRGRLTPSMLFYKALHLDTLLPHSRRFGAYNLSYLDENQVHEVGTVVGAFMMIRRECLEDVGLLDESYFMYGEDADLCYRVNDLGWKVFYAPVGNIVHYKGQSTGKRSYLMIRHWYSAAWKLYQRRTAPKYPSFVNALVWGGFWTMCLGSFAANFFRATKRVPGRR
ncbi:MAG TPA: glycosyltransferase family 2 protein [Candidatus Acidoferrales bacterium]|nr:glycosyltransferase family 2 protein [Candidatus Acidoferrales bacterium]